MCSSDTHTTGEDGPKKNGVLHEQGPTRAPTILLVVQESEDAVCPVSAFTSYRALIHPDHCDPQSALFKSYHNQSGRFIQAVGKKQYQALAQKLAVLLGKPEQDVVKYTSHSFRRTCATQMADDMNVSFEEKKRFGRWKSDQVIREYVEENDRAARKVAAGLSTAKASSSSASRVETTSPFSFHGCTVSIMPPASQFPPTVYRDPIVPAYGSQPALVGQLPDQLWTSPLLQ